MREHTVESAACEACPVHPEQTFQWVQFLMVVRTEMPVPRMPDQLYELLKDAPVKKIVGPIEANDFDLFLMKCDKRTVSVLPKADMIKKQLEMEKMEQRSEKKLQELKKKAVIEKK